MSLFFAIYLQHFCILRATLQRASVLDDQKEVYKKIIENGTKVDVQFTTTDKAEPLESKVSL